MEFLPTTYEPGVSLRYDIFNRQFTVEVTGRMYYPEDDPVYGTYSCEETLTVCEAATINEAATRLLQLYESDNWPIRDENIDYYDANLGHDCGPVDFYPYTVKIVDRHGRLVLGGNFRSGNGINWFPPVIDSQAIAELEMQRERLLSQAAYEHGWDNYETARALWREADYLSLHFAHKKYTSLSEVENLISHTPHPKTHHSV
ncbi:hypothetical protein [Citrobacter werkmanii]|uniref:hypothetical protein n=1 Tax=Citrobacter werkmanii TaxID=67827 RepID=UPI002650A3DD|nr:hypothetical protein [Citrobacter werkmanii]MDN8554971.1 hypothetical protein [Citrobacter werkmanii]